MRFSGGRVGTVRLLATVGLLAVGSPAAAETLFGPQTFTLSTQAPQTFTVTFPRPAFLPPAYSLHLENGEPDGSHRLRQATLTLNDVEIVGPLELGPHVALVDTPISLLPTNVLTVTLDGPRHSRLRIQIERREASLVSVTPNTARQGEILPGRKISVAASDSS